MDLSGLLTSVGINIGLCPVLFILYSVLRKQPGNASVYFGRTLAQFWSNRRGHFFGKLFPRWILEAWEASDEKILASGGLDAVAFLRIITFSGQIFSIAAVIGIALVYLSLYDGKEKLDQHILSMSLDVFTIGNIREGSNWLWVHCLALYFISFFACRLLHSENKNIAKMRLEHIVGSSRNPSYFTIIVRAIPSSPEESFSDSVRNFFSNYYDSSYLSHQMVYRSGTVKKLMNDESKMSTSTEQLGTYLSSGLGVGKAHPFKVLSSEPESVRSQNVIADPDLGDKECVAALVFFKTRHAALIASQAIQFANPRSWVTDLAPEPHDVYWKNLSIPYWQLWGRKIAIILGSTAFTILFMFVVNFVQGLLLLEQLHERFPSRREVLMNKFMVSVIAGYLPSAVLTSFLYVVPPTMMLFAKIEGPISRSGRKKGACRKVFYFLIWNVFFVYVLSANIMERLVGSSPKDLTAQLAEEVPLQATFFMTYVMTSGWVSLASEIMQPCSLVCNFFSKYILRKDDEPSNGTLSFPYHTEIPKVLLFGYLGFNYSLVAPLLLPFLMVLFFLGSFVYRNQIMNVYVKKYDSGGQFWPMMHNFSVFSLAMAQVIAIGIFGLKRSSAEAVFTVLLLIFTLLFNEYCRQKFHPLFKDNAAQVLIEMDRIDEQCGSMEVIHKQLPSAYCQFASSSNDLRKSVLLNPCHDGDNVSICIPDGSNPGSKPTQGNESWGSIKLNIGCWYSTDGKSGFGGIFRYPNGKWILGYHGCMNCDSRLEIELWAIYKGLTTAVEKSIQNVSIESDSRTAVHLINEGVATNHARRNIIQASKVMLTPTGAKLSHIFRKSNESADHLARMGAEQKEEILVFEKMPISIREFMIRDCLNIRYALD